MMLARRARGVGRASAGTRKLSCFRPAAAAAASAAPGRLPPPPPPPRNRRVVVTGLGVISPFGVGLDRTWRAVVSGATATRRGAYVHVPGGAHQGEQHEIGVASKNEMAVALACLIARARRGLQVGKEFDLALARAQ